MKSPRAVPVSEEALLPQLELPVVGVAESNNSVVSVADNAYDCVARNSHELFGSMLIVGILVVIRYIRKVRNTAS